MKFPTATRSPWAFQITRRSNESTGADAESTASAGSNQTTAASPGSHRYGVWIESIVIALVFAASAAQLPPDVNESHYLTKAKHFWDASWCEGDLFLASSFSHWFFYVSCGWLTKFMSLSAFAWTGRVLTWLALAFAWRRLSHALIPLRGFAVLSSAFFLVLNERFHLAGEWVVGGFEAKGFAYAFVILALSFLVEKKWKFVWPALGMAALFHVLVGGWALLSVAFAFVLLHVKRSHFTSCVWTMARSLRPYVWSMAATVALLLAAALPPLLSDWSAAPAAAAEARLIYVNQRISHHLTFGAFPASHVARFSLLLIFGAFAYRWLGKNSNSIARRIKPLAWFAFGAILISYGGLMLSGWAETGDAASSWAAGLLRFYWFRLADFAVPAVLSLACCMQLSKWLLFGKTRYQKTLPIAFAAVIAAATGLMIVEKYADSRPVADQRALPTYVESSERTLATWRNWQTVCEWIRVNTSADAVFLTPAEQQTFKWYAQRQEIVAWKDIPQDAASIVEWRERIALFFDPQGRYSNGLLQYTDEQLVELAKRFGATHLLLPQYQVDLTHGVTKLKQVYPADADQKVTYVVFEF